MDSELNKNETDENGDSVNSEKNIKKAEKKSTKRAIIIWISALVVLGAAAFVLLRYPQLFDKNSGTLDVTGSNGFYDYFYEADFSLKLEEYEDYNEYLDLDRMIYFKTGNQTIGIPKDQISSQSDEVKFFSSYFDSIIAGDCKKYNFMFTEEYYKTHEEKEAFTPQMIYGILIEQLSQTQENGVREYVFDVSYKIFENNGTFRDDIYSDASRTQRITIDDSEGEYKISSVKFYVAS